MLTQDIWKIEPLAQIPHDKIAIGSWVWGSDYYHGRFSLLDLPQKAAELDIQQIECNDFILPPPRFSRLTQPFHKAIPYINPDLWRYRRASLTTLKKELDARNQTCLCWALNTDFTSPRVGWFANWFYHQWAIQAINILRPPLIRIIAGGTQTTPITGRLIQQMTNSVLLLLQRPSVKQIVFENHWGASTDMTQHIDIYRQVRKNLHDDEKRCWRLCLDPFNLESENPEKSWERMAPYAGHVHLKLGRDHGRLLQILEGVGYTGMFTIEELPSQP